MKALRVAVMALVLLLPAVSGRAAGVGDYGMPDWSEAGGKQLELNGVALRKAYFFKVYVAGLYLAEKSNDAKAVLAADGPRKMVMHFLRNVDRDDLCKGWRDGLLANTPAAGAEVRAAFDALCGYMPDIREGQDIVFVYLPGQGLSVEVAGVMKGVLEGGKATADAVLACWIGDRPGPGEDFRKALLGR